jgi:hypothetical protein
LTAPGVRPAKGEALAAASALQVRALQIEKLRGGERALSELCAEPRDVVRKGGADHPAVNAKPASVGPVRASFGACLFWLRRTCLAKLWLE